MTRTHLCLVKVSSMMNFMFASLAAAVGHYNTIVIVAAVSAAYTAKCLFRSSFLTVKCQQPSILMLIAELFPYFSVTKTARLDRFCILISRSLNHYSEMAASFCNCNSHHPASCRCWGGAVTVTGNMLRIMLLQATIIRNYFVKTQTSVASFGPPDPSIFFSNGMYLEVSPL